MQTFPVNGSDALWWVMLMHLCVTDIFSVMGWVVMISMMFDVVEDSQMRTGRRDEGLFLSGLVYFKKYFQVWVFIIGFVLQFLGFDNSQSNIEQMQEPINNLVIFVCISG